MISFALNVKGVADIIVENTRSQKFTENKFWTFFVALSFVLLSPVDKLTGKIKGLRLFVFEFLYYFFSPFILLIQKYEDAQTNELESLIRELTSRDSKKRSMNLCEELIFCGKTNFNREIFVETIFKA